MSEPLLLNMARASKGKKRHDIVPNPFKANTKNLFTRKPRKRARKMWKTPSKLATPVLPIVSDNDDNSSLVSSNSVIGRPEPEQSLRNITRSFLRRKVSMSSSSSSSPLQTNAPSPNSCRKELITMKECIRPRKRRRLEFNLCAGKTVLPPRISVTKRTKISGFSVGSKVAILNGPFKQYQGKITHKQADKVKVCFRPGCFLIHRWVDRKDLKIIRTAEVGDTTDAVSARPNFPLSRADKSAHEIVTIEVASGAEADVSTMGEFESIRGKTNHTTQTKENLLGMEIIHPSSQELTASAAGPEISTQISFGSMTTDVVEVETEPKEVNKSSDVAADEEDTRMQSEILMLLNPSDGLMSDSNPSELFLNTQTLKGSEDEELLKLVENLLEAEPSNDPLNTVVDKDSEMVEDFVEFSEDLFDIELLNPFKDNHKLSNGKDISDADLMYIESSSNASADGILPMVTPELDKGFLDEFVAEVCIGASSGKSDKNDGRQGMKELEDSFAAPVLGEASVGSVDSAGNSLSEDEHGVCSNNFLDDLVHIHIPNGLLEGK